MLSDNDLFIRLCIFGFGLVLVAIGLWQKRTANRLRSFPLTMAPAVVPGEPASVSGRVEAGEFRRVKSEVGEKITRWRRDKNGIDREYTTEEWSTVSDEGTGGFLLQDGVGLSLIVPTLKSLDLDQSGSTNTNRSFFGSTMDRQTVWVLGPGETVYCSGTPRSAAEFLADARAAADVPEAVLTRVLQLTKAETKVPCFYGDAIDTIEDQTYDAALKFDERSAQALFMIGGAIAGTVALYRAFELAGLL